MQEIDNEIGKVLKIENSTDWGPALRRIKAIFNSRADDMLARAIPIGVQVGDNTIVPVQAIYGQPEEGEAYKVSGIKTLDAQINAVNLGALASEKRVLDPGSIVASFEVGDDGTTQNSDIAAVEAGISEQAYGGRTAMIAALLTHKYGELLLKKTGDRELINDYHKVYLGSGKGGAQKLASYQRISKEIKQNDFQREEVKPKPTTIAAQIQAIRDDLERYSSVIIKRSRTRILKEIKKEARALVNTIYAGEVPTVRSNLKKNINQAFTYLTESRGNKLSIPDSITFETQGITKLKAEGPEFSDDGGDGDEEIRSRKKKKRKRSVREDTSDEDESARERKREKIKVKKSKVKGRKKGKKKRREIV